jgi:hypothetical protein
LFEKISDDFENNFSDKFKNLFFLKIKFDSENLTEIFSVLEGIKNVKPDLIFLFGDEDGLIKLLSWKNNFILKTDIGDNDVS